MLGIRIHLDPNYFAGPNNFFLQNTAMHMFKKITKHLYEDLSSLNVYLTVLLTES